MIIDETPDFWVLNKPNGVSINDESGHSLSSLGLVSQFRSALIQGEQGQAGQGQGEQTPVAPLNRDIVAHPVHRLDKGTSGIFILAKNAEANRILSQAFNDREVEKVYIAITECKPGHSPKKKQGWVVGDMEKSRSGSWKLLKTKSNPARTFFVSKNIAPRRRFCALKPISGKTHQLRVAMKALSMPILGDDRYGGVAADRMYLHAHKIKFEFGGTRYSYTCMPERGEHFSNGDSGILTELIQALEQKC